MDSRSRSVSAVARERFAADPADVLALASDPARWREWAGPLLRGLGARLHSTALEAGVEHTYEVRPVGPLAGGSGRITVQASPEGGGELKWSHSIPVTHPLVGSLAGPVSRACLTRLTRRLVTEADRRVAVTRRPSLPSRLQRAGLRLIVRPVLTVAPFDEKWIRALRAVATTASRAAGSRRRARPAVGAPVPGLWIDGPPDAPGLLVLHGGGYVACSPDTHATMAATLARLSRTIAYVPDYRLAPEHKYPAALDDAETAFRHLAEQVGGAERVAIVGDSAGGGLALGLLDRLQRRGERPAALGLISPWVDLTEPLGTRSPGGDRSAGGRAGGALDPLMPPSVAADCRDAYAGDTPIDDPGISPARRPLDATAPPVAIVCGGDDFVVDDVRAFVDAGAARGAVIDLRVWPGMVHCFPVVAGTPEGASALAVLAAHITGATGRR